MIIMNLHLKFLFCLIPIQLCHIKNSYDISNHTTTKKRLRHLNNSIEAFISRSEYEKKLTSPTILCELTVANGEGFESENFSERLFEGTYNSSLFEDGLKPSSSASAHLFLDDAVSATWRNAWQLFLCVVKCDLKYFWSVNPTTKSRLQ